MKVILNELNPPVGFKGLPIETAGRSLLPGLVLREFGC